MKTIYYDKNLRCTIKYVKYMNHFHCKLQKRFLFIFWCRVYKTLDLREGFWGEDWPYPFNRNPLVSCYNTGNLSESWKTGTLEIRNRITDFFIEYLDQLSKEERTAKKLQTI